MKEVVKKGRRYGNLIAIKRSKYLNQNRRPEFGWKCIDDSGKIKYQRNYQLLSRNIIKVPVRAGRKYGEFTTIELVRMPTKKGRIYKWKCTDRNGDIVYHSIYFLSMYKHRRRIYLIEIGNKYGEFTVLEKVKHITSGGKKVDRWKCSDEKGAILTCKTIFLIKRRENRYNRKRHIIEKGKQYGEFTAVKLVRNYITRGGITKSLWMCKDDKGIIKYCRPQFLTSRKTIKEQEKLKEIQDRDVADLVRDNKHQTGIRNRLYYEYQANAEKRDISFCLSFKAFNLIIINNCHYCGTEPTSVDRWKKKEHKNQPKLKYNGIDRIDSDKGYNLKNVVPCCSICNLMKNYLKTDIFLAHIPKIYEFQKINN